MGVGRAEATFRVAAAGALLLGLLFLSGTWDGLYDTLDLPQPAPALTAQVGGAALVALALLLWSAPRSAELRRVAATAGLIAYGGAALVIAAWLIFKDQEDLGIDDLGTVLLIAAAVVLAVLAAAMAQAARSPRASR